MVPYVDAVTVMRVGTVVCVAFVYSESLMVTEMLVRGMNEV